MRRLVVALLLVCLSTMVLVPSVSASAEKLPASLKQFAKAEGLEFAQITVVQNRTYYEFTKLGRRVVVTQEFVDECLDKQAKPKPKDVSIQHTGSHNMLIDAIDWIGRVLTVLTVCNYINQAILDYNIRNGTGYEGYQYSVPVCDIINGVVNWR